MSLKWAPAANKIILLFQQIICMPTTFQSSQQGVLGFFASFCASWALPPHNLRTKYQEKCQPSVLLELLPTSLALTTRKKKVIGETASLQANGSMLAVWGVCTTGFCTLMPTGTCVFICMGGKGGRAERISSRGTCQAIHECYVLSAFLVGSIKMRAGWILFAKYII